MKEVQFSHLCASRQRLIKLLHDIHFGRLERLCVRGGEPVFNDQMRIIRTVKIAGHSEPRPVLPADYVLKRELVTFLRQLDRLGDALISRIEIAHGVPLLMELESTAA